MSSLKLTLPLFAFLLALPSIGCVVHDGAPAPQSAADATEDAEPEAATESAPPADQAETPPPAPTPAHVWIAGRWRWAGGAWRWAPGHWVGQRAGWAWVPGHWAKHHNRRAYQWIPGHWTRS